MDVEPRKENKINDWMVEDIALINLSGLRLMGKGYFCGYKIEKMRRPWLNFSSRLRRAFNRWHFPLFLSNWDICQLANALFSSYCIEHNMVFLTCTARVVWMLALASYAFFPPIPEGLAEIRSHVDPRVRVTYKEVFNISNRLPCCWADLLSDENMRDNCWSEVFQWLHPPASRCTWSADIWHKHVFFGSLRLAQIPSTHRWLFGSKEDQEFLRLQLHWERTVHAQWTQTRQTPLWILGHGITTLICSTLINPFKLDSLMTL